MAHRLSYPFDIRLWWYGINWSSPFRVTHSALTRISESRAQREQRAGMRHRPRRSFDFTSRVKKDSRRDFYGTMAKWRARPIVVPEVHRGVRLTGARSAGSTTLPVSEVTSWVVEERFVVLHHADRWGLCFVDSIAGSTLTIHDALDEDWPEGTRVYPGVTTRIETVTTSEQTDDVWIVNISASGQPTSPVETISAAAETFNSREVFPFVFNWGETPTSEWEKGTEVIDYRRGRREFFYPADYLRRLRTATVMLKSVADGDAMRDFFHRMLGQLDEFYIATGANDLPLLSKTSNTLTVAGTEVNADFADDQVYRAICVTFRDGSRIYRQVTDINQSGANSVLTLGATWAFDNEDVKMISWFTVCRLASDELTIEWLTDSVGTCQLSMLQLEDLDGD